MIVVIMMVMVAAGIGMVGRVNLTVTPLVMQIWKIGRSILT